MGKPKNEVVDAEVVEEINGATEVVPKIDKETFNALGFLKDLEEEEKRFQEVNGHLGIDFVDYIGYIRKDATGKLFDTAGEDPDKSLGDEIYIVPGSGESQYALWVPEGLEDKFENTSLLCRDTDKDKVIEYINEHKEANAPGFENITEDDINKEYLTLVAFWTKEDIQNINKGNKPKDIQIRYLNFRSAAFYNWKQYITQVFKGVFSGIPKGTGVSSIITKINTVSQKNRNNAKIQFINYEFEPITFEQIKNI